MVMYITPFDIPTFTLVELGPKLQRKTRQTATHVKPAVFTKQTDAGEKILQIDLPGVERKHVSVEMNGRKLIVSGKRYKSVGHTTLGPQNEAKTDKQDTGAIVYRRAFELGRDVDLNAVRVGSLEDGVLTLLLPRKAQAQPRKIVIE
ncbi:unnamed protein product [Agarophyton chilense]